MSWEYANKLEKQLRGEVEGLLQRTDTESRQAQPEIDIPDELQRCEGRIVKIAEIKAELERGGYDRGRATDQ